ncbi:unnamed protein product [Paramecium sonneborni]|uniref:Uncharacterized protein n=1 Tax=Paramecium sonneborni TaxID=65129 RepID=A0A8S1N631_9CILI|nr:unnamed protein product [Paramecium sonneborni]
MKYKSQQKLFTIVLFKFQQGEFQSNQADQIKRTKLLTDSYKTIY